MNKAETILTYIGAFVSGCVVTAATGLAINKAKGEFATLDIVNVEGEENPRMLLKVADSDKISKVKNGKVVRVKVEVMNVTNEEIGSA